MLELTAYLGGLAAHGMLTGTVLVTRDGMSYTAAFGYADRAARTPDTDQTEYRLGSVSKQFTAMGVLLLAARHRLIVTDRVCRYLPGCPARWRAVTIADLLDHTSGIPGYLNDLAAGTSTSSSWPTAKPPACWTSAPPSPRSPSADATTQCARKPPPHGARGLVQYEAVIAR